MGTDYCIYKFKKSYKGKEIEPNHVVSICDFVTSFLNSAINEREFSEKTDLIKYNIEEYIPMCKKYCIEYDDYVKWLSDPKENHYGFYKSDMASKDEWDHLFSNNIVKTSVNPELKHYWNDDVFDKEYVWKCVFDARSIVKEGLDEWLEKHGYYWNSCSFNEKIDKKDLDFLLDDLRRVIVNHNKQVSKAIFPSYDYEYDNEYYEMVLTVHEMISNAMNKTDFNVEDLYLYVSC